MAEQWLSIVEYARTYRVSDMTVRRRIKTGRLHAVLKEGKYFIPVPLSEARDREPRDERDTKETRLQPAWRDHTKQVGAGLSGAAQLQPLGKVTNQTHAQVSREVNAISETEYATIPSTLRRPMAAQETSLVDTRALLAFCEASLRKAAEAERRTIDRFKAKLEALEAQLATRNMEVNSLKQQNEDLQLLVQVLEGKHAG